MTGIFDIHEEHGATFTERGGQRVVADYGRPERSHAAVRNVVGVIEHCEDVLVVTGEDRVDYVDNAISNVVPSSDGSGVYALLLTPQGRVRTDMYVLNAGSRLLLFLPPGLGEEIADEWREKTFIQDVEIADSTGDFSLYGVHGPSATEKIASVFTETTPDEHLEFVRGTMVDAGVTVMRTDALTGEEGYLVVCNEDDGEDVFDTLENRGLNAAPFGYRTWETLTLEAGTPLFETELVDRLPNNLGLENAVDYEKGCFVGQEVVSRIQNRGHPNQRLVGLSLDEVPESGATVFQGDETLGEITRGVDSPTLGKPIAFALVDFGFDGQNAEDELRVRIDGEERAATAVELPFVDGSDQSGRLPRY